MSINTKITFKSSPVTAKACSLEAKWTFEYTQDFGTYKFTEPAVLKEKRKLTRKYGKKKATILQDL